MLIPELTQFRMKSSQLSEQGLDQFALNLPIDLQTTRGKTIEVVKSISDAHTDKIKLLPPFICLAFHAQESTKEIGTSQNEKFLTEVQNLHSNLRPAALQTLDTLLTSP